MKIDPRAPVQNNIVGNQDSEDNTSEASVVRFSPVEAVQVVNESINKDRFTEKELAKALYVVLSLSTRDFESTRIRDERGVYHKPTRSLFEFVREFEAHHTIYPSLKSAFAALASTDHVLREKAQHGLLKRYPELGDFVNTVLDSGATTTEGDLQVDISSGLMGPLLEEGESQPELREKKKTKGQRKERKKNTETKSKGFFEKMKTRRNERKGQKLEKQLPPTSPSVKKDAGPIKDLAKEIPGDSDDLKVPVYDVQKNEGSSRSAPDVVMRDQYKSLSTTDSKDSLLRSTDQSELASIAGDLLLKTHLSDANGVAALALCLSLSPDVLTQTRIEDRRVTPTREVPLKDLVHEFRFLGLNNPDVAKLLIEIDTPKRTHEEREKIAFEILEGTLSSMSPQEAAKLNSRFMVKTPRLYQAETRVLNGLDTKAPLGGLTITSKPPINDRASLSGALTKVLSAKGSTAEDLSQILIRADHQTRLNLFNTNPDLFERCKALYGNHDTTLELLFQKSVKSERFDPAKRIRFVDSAGRTRMQSDLKSIQPELAEGIVAGKILHAEFSALEAALAAQIETQPAEAENRIEHFMALSATLLWEAKNPQGFEASRLAFLAQAMGEDPNYNATLQGYDDALDAAKARLFDLGAKLGVSEAVLNTLLSNGLNGLAPAAIKNSNPSKTRELLHQVLITDLSFDSSLLEKLDASLLSRKSSTGTSIQEYLLQQVSHLTPEHAQHLKSLAAESSNPLSGAARIELKNLKMRRSILADLVTELGDPGTIVQGKYGTCALASAQYLLCKSDPAEYTRIVSTLGKHGLISARFDAQSRRWVEDGHEEVQIPLRRGLMLNYNRDFYNLNRPAYTGNEAEKGGRTLTSAMFQSAFAQEAYDFVAYQDHVPGRANSTAILRSPVSGEEFVAGGFNPVTTADTFARVLGKQHKEVAAQWNTGVSIAPKQLLNALEGLALYEISPSNPAILCVNFPGMVGHALTLVGIERDAHGKVLSFQVRNPWGEAERGQLGSVGHGLPIKRTALGPSFDAGSVKIRAADLRSPETRLQGFSLHVFE